MCIMDVKADDPTHIVAQAMAHNVSTVERDMDMLEKLLEAREDAESLERVQHAHSHLKAAYADLLAQYGTELHNHHGCAV
jgi:hypothetical protein